MNKIVADRINSILNDYEKHVRNHERGLWNPDGWYCSFYKKTPEHMKYARLILKVVEEYLTSNNFKKGIKAKKPTPDIQEAALLSKLKLYE